MGRGVGLKVSGDDPFDDLDIPDDPFADLERADQILTIQTEERRYGKKMVVIEGIDNKDDLGTLASELKSALGTGGTVKEDRIEIQGDHGDRIRDLLKQRGYEITGS